MNHLNTKYDQYEQNTKLLPQLYYVWKKIDTIVTATFDSCSSQFSSFRI